MKKKLIFFGVGLIIIVCTLLAFTPTSTKSKAGYHHMIIIARNIDLDYVFISIDGKEYAHYKKLKKESQGDWDMNPVINLIHEYEADGWELMNFSPNGEYHDFWLRKEK